MCLFLKVLIVKRLRPRQQCDAMALYSNPDGWRRIIITGWERRGLPPRELHDPPRADEELCHFTQGHPSNFGTGSANRLCRKFQLQSAMPSICLTPRIH